MIFFQPENFTFPGWIFYLGKKRVSYSLSEYNLEK